MSCERVLRILCAAVILLSFGCRNLSKQEREDQNEMDRYRKFWATPGRTSWEIEEEARGQFRKKNGRDPEGPRGNPQTFELSERPKPDPEVEAMNRSVGAWVQEINNYKSSNPSAFTTPDVFTPSLDL